MNNKCAAALTAFIKNEMIIIIIFTLFSGMIIGCTRGQKGNTGTTTMLATTKLNGTSAMEGTQGRFAEEQKVKSVLEIMLDSFEKKDDSKFRQIISPKGVVIIRSIATGNYISPNVTSSSQVSEKNKNTETKKKTAQDTAMKAGTKESASAGTGTGAAETGTRGMNYRGIFSQTSFPESFTIELNGELLFKPEKYFLNIERYNVSDIPVIKLDEFKFGFKDDMYNHILEPDTLKIWRICSEIRNIIGSENNWRPYIIITNSGEAVFTISETGSNTGNWAVFEKTDDKYYLRALLDFR